MESPSHASAAPLRALGAAPPRAESRNHTRFQALVKTCRELGWEQRLCDRLVQAPGPFLNNEKEASAFVATYRRAPAAERAFLWLQFDLAQPAPRDTAQELGARLVDFAQHPHARAGGLGHLAAEVTRRTRDTGEFTEVVHQIYDAAAHNRLPPAQYRPLLHGIARGVLEARTPDNSAKVAQHAESLARLLLGSAADADAHWLCIHTGLTEMVNVCTAKNPPAALAVNTVVACLDAVLKENLAADRKRDLEALRRRFPGDALPPPLERVQRPKPAVAIQRAQGPPSLPTLTRNPAPRSSDSDPAADSDREEFTAAKIDAEDEFDPTSDVAEPESIPFPESVSEAASDADSEQSVLRPRSRSGSEEDSEPESHHQVTWHQRPAAAQPVLKDAVPRPHTRKVRAREPARPSFAEVRLESKLPALPVAITAIPDTPPKPSAKPAPQNLHHLTSALAESLWLQGAFQNQRLPESKVLEQHDAHLLGKHLAQRAPDGRMAQIARHLWNRSQDMGTSAEWLGRFYAGWVETWAPGARTLKVLQATEVSNTVFDNYKKLLAPRLSANDQAACARLDLQLVTCLNAVAQKLSVDSGRIINDKLGKALRGHMRPEHVQRDFLEIVTSARSARSGAGPRRPEPPGRGSPGWHN